MCGIVGHISKSNSKGITWKAEKAFNSLLFVDTVRGDDATGIFLVEEDGATKMMKESFPAPWVLGQKEHVAVMKSAFDKGRFIVGHNRKATIGKINDETSHPFIIDNELLLVHNGTLNSYKHLFKDALSDSHAIAHVIHEGIQNKDKWNDMFWRFNGAYALVFYDRRTETFHIIRNSQRPLHLVETDADGWFFASEQGMLEWVLGREGIKIKSSTPVEINTLYSIGLDSDTFEKIPITTPSFQQPTHTNTPATTAAWVGKKMENLLSTTAATSQTSESTTGTTKSSIGAFTLGKNIIKKIRSQFMNRLLEVVVEDATEGSNGDFDAYGESSEITYPHIVEMVLVEKDVKWLQSQPSPGVRGIVKKVDRTPDNTRILITIEPKELKNVQPVLTH